MRNIKVEQLNQLSVERQMTELVERKGIGHPDSLADGISESISRALCHEYTKRVGTILHHNTDETQIVAGRSRPAFGGGEIIRPIYILLTGRATRYFNEVEIPVDIIAIKAAKNHMKSTLRNLDVNEDLILESKIGTGSSDLRDVFQRAAPCANDTSFGVGYAPLSETENLVYNTERYLMNLRDEIPAIGEDVKVMGMRKGDVISLTIACAMVGKHLDNLDHYIEAKREIAEKIQDNASNYTPRKVNVQVNVADDIERGSVFLTVTGTSAEMGDDGSVGRGNRANGLITLNRPMSMEASAGKNPIRHVGKIYNLLSNLIANQIVEEVEEVEEVYIRILSQIGKPIDQPHVLSAQTLLKEGASLSSVQPKIDEIADYWLENITTIPEKLMKEEIETF